MNRTSEKKAFLNDCLTYGLVILAFVIVQVLVNGGAVSSLFKGLLVPLCTYAILAVSLNLVVGISGELSLGHAGFMCVGAFSSALFTNLMAGKLPSGLDFVLAVLIGAAVAAFFGFLIGIPVLRLQGDYLAIVTLAFGEIVKNIINALYLGVDAKGVHVSLKDTAALKLEAGGKILIKGAQGITGTPRLSTFFAGIVLLLLSLFIVQNLIRSRTGRAIMAIRDNEIAAESVGLHVTRYKLLAFTISAALAGVGGVLYAHNLSTLQALPKNFGYNMSIAILVFVVMGGIGNMRGSVIAAVVLTALPELLRGLSDFRMLIYAVVLILMMLFTSAPSFIQYRERLFSGFRKPGKQA